MYTGSNPVLTTRLSDPTCLQLGCELLVGSLSYYGRDAKIKNNMMPPFAIQVEEVLDQIQTMLIDKNRKYGNSALEPIGLFSQLSAKEGLLIRIDDKLKRIKNGSLEKDDEDVVNDLIGYLILLKISDNQQSQIATSNKNV